MEEREIRALVKAIERLLGDPLLADKAEVDALFAEFGEGKNPAQTVFDLVSKAAQKYRLEGKTVPVHVAEALWSTKKLLFGESGQGASADSVIGTLLDPMLGPAREVSYAFRNRKERTEADRGLLEELSDEVKKDWSKDDEE